MANHSQYRSYMQEDVGRCLQWSADAARQGDINWAAEWHARMMPWAKRALDEWMRENCHA